MLLLLASCAGDADATTDSAADLCDDRTGGALITIQVTDDKFSFWATDPTFIDTAAAHLANGTQQVPNFAEVLPGTDCDPRWSWHVDPARLEWADFTVEVCDATPAYIEEDPQSWISSVGSWCPWLATVTAVDDRR